MLKSLLGTDPSVPPSAAAHVNGLNVILKGVDRSGSDIAYGSRLSIFTPCLQLGQLGRYFMPSHFKGAFRQQWIFTAAGEIHHAVLGHISWHHFPIWGAFREWWILCLSGEYSDSVCEWWIQWQWIFTVTGEIHQFAFAETFTTTFSNMHKMHKISFKCLQNNFKQYFRRSVIHRQ